MPLETSDILQINATIITGILILLTVTTFADPTGKIDILRKISTIVIIIPFTISALLSLQRNMRKLLFVRYLSMDRQELTYRLDEIERHISDASRNQGGNYPHKLSEDRDKILNRLRQIDESKEEINIDHPSRLSLIFMYFGFVILTALMSFAVIYEIFFNQSNTV